MKAVVAAFNQEKALVRAFSVITNLRMDLFQALELISPAAVSKCWMCADKEKLQPNNNTSISFFCSNIFYRFNIANIYDEFSLGLSDFHNILWIELQIISVKKERDLNK